MYYQRLSDEEILSGFREGDADIDLDLDMPEVMDEMAILRREATLGEARMSMPAPSMPGSMADMAESMVCEDMDFIREEVME